MARRRTGRALKSVSSPTFSCAVGRHGESHMSLKVCAAMPDEPAWGQFRRMALENGLHSQQALLRLFSNGDEGTKGGEGSLLSARVGLAKLMAGGSRREDLLKFYRAHCIHPQIFESSRSIRHWWRFVMRWGLHHGNLYPSRMVVRSCNECACEDVEKLGFSWYRQGHQLPGIDWCLKHECPLHEFPAGVDLVRSTFWKLYPIPRASPERPQPLPPFVRRYMRAMEFLRNSRKVDAWDQFGRETLLAFFGSAGGSFEEINLLEGHVVDAAPKEWYRIHFKEPTSPRF